MIADVISRCLDTHKKYKNLKKFALPMALQIEAVSCEAVPKSAFLYDLSLMDADFMQLILNALINEKLVSDDLKVVTLAGEIFILKLSKVFSRCRIRHVVDASDNLEKPKLLTDQSKLNEIIKMINVTLATNRDKEVIEIELNSFECPTIFGHLINYPVLYYCATENNCLSEIELLVFQVELKSNLLMSFSLPHDIYNENEAIRDDIKTFLNKFPENYLIKSFTTSQPHVIL